MSDLDKKLGKKIRDIRVEKGITQKSLAGDKITRNMLSLIESGNASPSLSTLMYLSEKLDTPAGYFFSTTSRDEGIYQKFLILDRLKAAFKQRNFKECETIANRLPQSSYDDELSYILAVAYLNTSLDAAAEFDMRTAAEKLATAEVLGENSIYCGEGFSNAVEYYSELYRSVCAEDIPGNLCDSHFGGELVPHELIEYFRAIKLISQGEDVQAFFQRGSFFDRHVTALNLLMDGRTTDALKRLRDLSEDPALPYYMHYRVLSDLENAANITGDVRIAYASSKRKLELTTRFRVY